MILHMKSSTLPILLAMILSACSGGGGASADAVGSISTSPTSAAVSNFPPSSSLAEQCAAPRPAGTINPDTNQPYGDTQGSLTTEMAWIASYVNETYLWYDEVPVVSSAPYAIGATVPYVDPTTNLASTTTLGSNYDVVDAYFNSQRTPLFTASGKPKDQFHFTYVTTDWQALSAGGSQPGFGFQVALLAASPPRQALVAYVSPGTPATQNNLGRGAQFLSVNGVDVVNGSDVATLNEGLFSPVVGTQYTFQVLDQGSTTPRTVTMTASNVALTPVQNAGTLPAPNSTVGYILFNDHVATAESELITAVNQLKASNNGAGVSDLVLDIRYNGGGYLDIASELAYMIAGAASTTGKTFEQDSYNIKNPFNFTAEEEATPFHNVTQGFSVTAGQALPQLGLSTVYVITSNSTCSASEAIMNGLLGIGVHVIQVGGTTCGKPYGFFPQDNCNTTYFAIQFQGVNNAGFGGYADGFIPAGSGSTANNLPGCVVVDDFTKQLGDPNEARLAAALQYRASGTCPVASAKWLARARHANPILMRSPFRENRIFRAKRTAASF
jgi:carboxyl-terminal processing protease